MEDQPRYRLDDLRRVGAALLAGHGVAPARASAFVSSLLWYEAASAPEFGIASLPGWLDAIEADAVDQRAEGVVGKEFTATAVLDGRRGLPPLILARAAEIAQEKAREIGLGMVRVVNLARVGPVAEVASEIALGPMVGTVEGPAGTYAVAVPAEGTVPAVFDTTLAPDARRAVPSWAGDPAGGWLVTARAVSAFESLAGFHERVASSLQAESPLTGEIRPESWQARRLEHLDRGLPLPESVAAELRARAGRLGLTWPSSS